ncbi:hypothetical protein KUV57_24875 [Epibacterium sp. DP7N7-1]|nr:hypothetical protein [Epibacterium sp. DP7N7-1]
MIAAIFFSAISMVTPLGSPSEALIMVEASTDELDTVRKRICRTRPIREWLFRFARNASGGQLSDLDLRTLRILNDYVGQVDDRESLGSSGKALSDQELAEIGRIVIKNTELSSHVRDALIAQSFREGDRERFCDGPYGGDIDDHVRELLGL